MRKGFIAVAAVLGLLAPSAAHATLLPPGATVTPVAESGTFTQLATTGPLTVSFATTMGKLQASVGTFTGNPFGSSDMTFIFQVKLDTGSGLVEHLTGASFTSFQTDVGFMASGPLGTGTVAPTGANRAFDGSVVKFDFVPGLSGGQLSETLIINTDAPSFGKGTIGLIDGSAQGFDGFQPTPEPGTLLLLGGTALGVGAAAAWRRRKVRATT
jgi:hypothetical protein